MFSAISFSKCISRCVASKAVGSSTVKYVCKSEAARSSHSFSFPISAASSGLLSICAFHLEGKREIAFSDVLSTGIESKRSCKIVCTRVPLSASSDGGSGNLSIFRYL